MSNHVDFGVIHSARRALSNELSLVQTLDHMVFRPCGFSIFRGLYLGPIRSDFVDFGVIRLGLMCSTILVQTDHF